MFLHSPAQNPHDRKLPNPLYFPVHVQTLSHRILHRWNDIWSDTTKRNPRDLCRIHNRSPYFLCGCNRHLPDVPTHNMVSVHKEIYAGRNGNHPAPWFEYAKVYPILFRFYLLSLSILNYFIAFAVLFYLFFSTFLRPFHKKFVHMFKNEKFCHFLHSTLFFPIQTLFFRT